MTKNKSYPIFLLILLGIIWGSGYSIARYAMTHGVPALGYSFWQSLGPAIFLLLLCFIKERRLLLSASHLRYFVIAGLLGIALPNTNMYFAAPHLPASLLAVIVNTVPIMMYPLALLARQEKFHIGRLIGVIIGIFGIMLVVGIDEVTKQNAPISSILMALITPLLFAVCALYSVYDRPKNTSSLQLATGMLVFSALMLTPLIINLHQFYPLTNLSLPNLVVMLEIVLSSIGYILFFELLRNAGPVYYSLVGGVVAITGTLWGILVFNETLSLMLIGAIALIIVAIFMVSLLQKTQEQKND